MVSSLRATFITWVPSERSNGMGRGRWTAALRVSQRERSVTLLSRGGGALLGVAKAELCRRGSSRASAREAGHGAGGQEALPGTHGGSHSNRAVGLQGGSVAKPQGLQEANPRGPQFTLGRNLVLPPPGTTILAAPPWPPLHLLLSPGPSSIVDSNCSHWKGLPSPYVDLTWTLCGIRPDLVVPHPGGDLGLPEVLLVTHQARPSSAPPGAHVLSRFISKLTLCPGCRLRLPEARPASHLVSWVCVQTLFTTAWSHHGLAFSWPASPAESSGKVEVTSVLFPIMTGTVSSLTAVPALGHVSNAQRDKGPQSSVPSPATHFPASQLSAYFVFAFLR